VSGRRHVVTLYGLLHAAHRTTYAVESARSFGKQQLKFSTSASCIIEKITAGVLRLSLVVASLTVASVLEKTVRCEHVCQRRKAMRWFLRNAEELYDYLCVFFCRHGGASDTLETCLDLQNVSCQATSTVAKGRHLVSLYVDFQESKREMKKTTNRRLQQCKKNHKDIERRNETSANCESPARTRIII